MPIVKHISIHSTPLSNIEYILNGDKNDEMKFAAGLNCSVNPQNAYDEFRRTLEYYAKERFFKSDLNFQDFKNDEKKKSKEKIRMELTVWDNDKIAAINLDEAIRSIKDNGTVNLDYQKFAENNDTVELAGEYLDLSQNLDEVYNDFLCRSGIFNDGHIDFVNEHGELPPDLNSAANRAAVSEYINVQLDSGDITETQRESLKTLQQEIRDFEEPLFIQEVEKIAEWCEEAQAKAAERQAERENQNFER